MYSIHRPHFVVPVLAVVGITIFSGCLLPQASFDEPYGSLVARKQRLSTGTKSISATEPTDVDEQLKSRKNDNPDKVYIPRVFFENGNLDERARSCQHAYDVSVSTSNSNRRNSIAFKTIGIVAATGFTVMAGVNSQLQGNIADNPRLGLSIAALVDASIAIGMTSFDAWYNFSERERNRAQDARQQRTLLLDAGMLKSCIVDEKAKEERQRFERLANAAQRSLVYLTGDQTASTEIVTLFDNHPGSTWIVSMVSRIDDVNQRNHRGQDELRKLATDNKLNAESGESALTKNYSKTMATQVLRDLPGVTIDAITAAIESKVTEKRKDLENFQEYSSRESSCIDSKGRPMSVLTLEQAISSKLNSCLDVTQTTYGPLPPMPTIPKNDGH